MAQYILEEVDIKDYEKLKILLALFKKIEVWFIQDIEMPRSWPYKELPVIKDEKEICSPLISIFEMMADSLDLL